MYSITLKPIDALHKITKMFSLAFVRQYAQIENSGLIQIDGLGFIRSGRRTRAGLNGWIRYGWGFSYKGFGFYVLESC